MINIYTYLIDFAYLLLKTIAESICFFIRSLPFPRPNKKLETSTAERLEHPWGWRGEGGSSLVQFFNIQHGALNCTLARRAFMFQPFLKVESDWKAVFERDIKRQSKKKLKSENNTSLKELWIFHNLCHHQISCLCLPFTPCTSTATSPNILLSWSQFVAIRNMIQIGWHVPHIYIFLRRKNGEKIGLPVYPSLNPAIIRIWCNKESKALVIQIGILFACKNRGKKMPTKWSSKENPSFLEHSLARQRTILLNAFIGGKSSRYLSGTSRGLTWKGLDNFSFTKKHVLKLQTSPNCRRPRDPSPKTTHKKTASGFWIYSIFFGIKTYCIYPPWN